MADFDIETVPFCQSSRGDGAGFLFSFGAYLDTHVVVLGCHLEDALEEALEWLDDHEPGCLSTVDASDYEEAARNLGITWPGEQTWLVALAELDDDKIQKISQEAETDMTMVSHTSLKNGNCVPSDEWSVRELEPSELEIVQRRSVHYVCGSGMSGCSYDHGPNRHRTEADAIADLAFVFEDSITAEELERMKAELESDGIYYFDNPSEAGADYCEVSEESGEYTEEEDETATNAGESAANGEG